MTIAGLLRGLYQKYFLPQSSQIKHKGDKIAMFDYQYFASFV
jgi:hypothetical protein